MSFGLPRSSMPEKFGLTEGHYGVEDNKLIKGLNGLSTNETITPSHPLEQSLKKNMNDPLNTMMLRNYQGLHAPLRLAMEQRCAGRVGRLSFLPSSHAMADVLSGRDTDIDFEDFLNPEEFKEGMIRPHFELK